MLGGWEDGDEEAANTPAMVSSVVLSTRALLLRSTESGNGRKLAPRIGLPTSATTNIQGRERLRPRLRVSDFLLKVSRWQIGG